MSSIHYRFRSSSEYETITFDGAAISVNELREAIMESNRMAKSPGHMLELTNAQTKEVYHLDSFMVPKNSSVVVKRVPIQRLEAVTSSATSGLSKEEEELTEIAFMKLTQTPDLANTEAPESEKIKAMIKQSTDVFNPNQYVNIRRAPPGYLCYRCNGRGHFLKDCPTQGDARYNNSQYQRAPSAGMPRAYFLLRMKQEEQLLTKLRAMQPENSRFAPVVRSDVVDQTKIPSELQCPMCKKLFTDVVVTPCCGFSYCDECIRNYLVEHDLVCVCKETTSPDNLIANKSLRISISNFRNQKKSEMKSVPQSAICTALAPSVVNSQFIASGSMNVQPVAAESMIIKAQPPDLQDQISQPGLTNGLIMESGHDSDPGIVNSPKKILPQTHDASNSPLLNVTNGNSQPPIASQQVFIPTTNGHTVTSLPASQTALIPGSLSSQVVPHPFPTNHGQAIYSNVHTPMRPGIILPQQQQRHLVPHPAVVAPSAPLGINLPPGATIVKRLVPVPVGPRLAPSQILAHQAQHAHMIATGGMNPHLVDPARLHVVVKPMEKHRGKEVASPTMQLTEHEFYLFQQQCKIRTTTTTATTSRRRHRSSSQDGSRERERFRSASRSRSRSRSRSPPSVDNKRHLRGKEGDATSSPVRGSKKRYDSADDSSQERRRGKDAKSRRKHRVEATLGSSKGSDPSKPRLSRAEKNEKTRELPEHIKREVDEFDFDNELEFDEELRNLRKTKQKRKSPEGSHSPSSKSLSPSKLERQDSKDDDIDMVVHGPEHVSPTPADKNIDKSDDKSLTLENDDVESIENVPLSNTDIKSPLDGKLDDSSTLTSPTAVENVVKESDGKPKKKTKIIKKKVVRLVKVTRKKPKTNSASEEAQVEGPLETGESDALPEKPKEEEVAPITPDTPQTPITPETPRTPEIILEKEECATSEKTATEEIKISTEVTETETTIDETETVCTKDNGDNDLSKSEYDDSVVELHTQTSLLEEDPLVLDNSVIITDQPLPENSRWETGGKTKVSQHGKVNEGSRVRTEKKKSRTDGSEKSAEKGDSTKAKTASDCTKVKTSISKEKLLAIKQLHATKSKVLSSDVQAIKEAEKRALIVKSKKTAAEKVKCEGKESGTTVDDEERRRRREKYMLKKQRAIERALAERQKAKLESEGERGVKSKVKIRRSDTDHSDHGIMTDERRLSDQGNYNKPADAKLKSISEITKKRLKQGDGCEPKKNEIEDNASDVLKSKVTSLKTVIGAAEKRRVIKTSVSEEREHSAPVIPDDLHVRRVIKVDDHRKKSLVSKVEKLAGTGDKSISIRADHEKRRHRDDLMSRRKRESSVERDCDDPMDRDRYERRVRLREEENLRREMKEKIRLREMEKEMREKEEEHVKSLEKEKLEGLERERLALREKEKLERKLKRERQLREDMIREKEENNEKDNKKKEDPDKKYQDKRKVTIGNNSDSGNIDDHKNTKRTKKEERKGKPGYIIQIIDSDKSDTESDSTDVEDRDKKKKKKSKRRKEKKRKKKADDNKSDVKADSEDSSEEETVDSKKKKKRKKEDSDGSSDEEEEEDRKKKKHKKHKKKHKKHRKARKAKKKSKKKKVRKEKEESESEREESQKSGEDSGEESTAESTKETQSSSSSDAESGASSASEKKKDGNDILSKTKDSKDVQGRVNPKENMVGCQSKRKSKSPLQSVNVNLLEEVSDKLQSRDRDVTALAKKRTSSTSKSARQSRESSESSLRNECDRTRSQKETSKTERSKDKSYVQIGGKIVNLKERHVKHDSHSKPATLDHNVKKTEEHRSSCNKEMKDVKCERTAKHTSPVHTKTRNETISDELELDYNDEDLGDLKDDVLYGDLDFADDEQTNPTANPDDHKLHVKKKSEDFEDGEILDEDLFASSRKKSKKISTEREIEDLTGTESENEDVHMLIAANIDIKDKTDRNVTKSNAIEVAIDNAVDDAINELSLEIDDGSESPPAKVKRMQKSATTTPKRVLRKR